MAKFLQSFLLIAVKKKETRAQVDQNDYKQIKSTIAHPSTLGEKVQCKSF